MATPDQPADEAQLRRELAVLTAEFATEQALERLRHAIKLCITSEVVECANYAAEAVTEFADLLALSSESTEMSVSCWASVTGCLESLGRLAKTDDVEGVVSMGKLAGDAIANFAAFLKTA